MLPDFNLSNIVLPDVITIASYGLIALGVLMVLRSLLVRKKPLRLNEDTGPEVVESRPAFGPLTRAMAAQIPSTATRRKALEQHLMQAGYYGRWACTNFEAVRNFFFIILVIAGGTVAVILGPEHEQLGLCLAGGGFLLALAVFAFPRLILRARARARIQRIEQGLPDAYDMINMCLAGGMSVRESIDQVADQIAAVHPHLATELGIVRRHAELGSFDKAFRHFADRTDSAEVRSWAGLIGDVESLGIDMQSANREQADGIRQAFRHKADERASMTGVKLILPYLFCLLPAVAMLQWGPAFLTLRAFISRESEPGGAFSQDLTRSAESLQREFNLPSSVSDDLPLRRGRPNAAIRRPSLSDSLYPPRPNNRRRARGNGNRR